MAIETPSLQSEVDAVKADLNARMNGLNPYLREALTIIVGDVWGGALWLLKLFAIKLVERMMPWSKNSLTLMDMAAEYQFYPNAASKAQHTLDITGTNGAVLAAGKVWQNTNGVTYTVDADVTIASGVATAAITAVEAGAGGTLIVGEELTLVSTESGIDSTGTVASVVVEGFDQETFDDFQIRFHEYLANVSTGGNKADYVRWAKEVPGVTRAWAHKDYAGAGTVGVSFCTDTAVGGPIPGAGKIAEVQAHVEALAPLHAANVVVFAPTAVYMNPNILVVPDTTEVRAAVIVELTDLLRIEGAAKTAEAAGITLALSVIDEAISIAAGETSHTLVTPASPPTTTATQVLLLGTPTWS